MKELQPQGLNVAACLKAQTGQKVFPVAGRQSSLVKSSQHQDSVVWNPAGAQSRDQRVARWEVRSVDCQEFPSKPHPVTCTDLAVDVSWLKPLRDGSDIPPSSWVRVFCWEWQPRFPCGVEHSLCCKELRAGASQRWLLICTVWSEADHQSLFLPGQGKFSSPLSTVNSDLLSDVFEASYTLQDYSNPKYLSSAHYSNKCLLIFIFFISLCQLPRINCALCKRIFCFPRP